MSWELRLYWILLAGWVILCWRAERVSDESGQDFSFSVSILLLFTKGWSSPVSKLYLLSRSFFVCCFFWGILCGSFICLCPDSDLTLRHLPLEEPLQDYQLVLLLLLVAIMQGAVLGSKVVLQPIVLKKCFSSKSRLSFSCLDCSKKNSWVSYY